MNTYVPWMDYFSVGDESLDAQHKQILSIINELYDARQTGNEDKKNKELLDRLVLYTKNHFAFEEQKMKACDYHDIENHKVLHDRMRQRTEGLSVNIDLITSHDLLKFLEDWWTGHIQTKDHSYTPYLNAAETPQQLAGTTA